MSASAAHKCSKIGWPRQAFRLSKEIIASTSTEEIKATIADMQELGIAQAPFDQMDILVAEGQILRLYAHEGDDQDRFEASKKRLAESSKELIFRFDNSQGPAKIVQCFVEGKPGHYENLGAWLEQDRKAQQAPPGIFLLREGKRVEEIISYEKALLVVGLDLLDILIVLLATKNIEKHVKESKLSRLGIGSRPRHQYVTLLSIGACSQRTDTSTIEDDGVARRPHLRRGHIRNQHHGPRNELLKRIWIQPVFVNADPAWIAERTAYNVSLSPQAKHMESVS